MVQMMAEPSSRSRWVIFCDECGDHALAKIDPDFPLFLLSMVLVEREEYVQRIVPALARFKLKWFDHEGVNLHSYEIRKIRPPFAFLARRESREAFHASLARMMADLPYRAFVVAVRKDRLLALRGTGAENPYDLALSRGMESVRSWIAQHGGGETAWVVEARGRREDRQLEETWSAIHEGRTDIPRGETLEFVPGRDNVAGLQLADLIGYPVARRILNPDRTNQAFDVLHAHLRDGREGEAWILLP